MVTVVTFATKEYAGSAEVLRHSALLHGGADRVAVYREKDAEPWFENRPALAAGKTVRGYGWWSWKPWVIRKALGTALPRGVVVYCDAGMVIEGSLDPYVAATAHVGLFRLGPVAKEYTNERWTKPDVLELMGATPAQRRAPQCNAAIQVWRNTPEAWALLDEYQLWCERAEVMDDVHRTLTPPPDFEDHRHDQSVLSVLAVDRPEVTLFKDPTQYGVDDPPLVNDTDSAPPLVHHHRARVNPVKIAVITPTVGTPHLAACLGSVQAQDIPNVHHYVVIDGPEHSKIVRAAVDDATRDHKGAVPLHILELPHNVGAGGWCGHK